MKRQDGATMNGHNNSVIENIKMNYDKLFSAEKKAADYILSNPGEAIISRSWPKKAEAVKRQ